MFRKLLKSKVTFTVLFSSFVAFIVLMMTGITSCEVGLGASVDTQPPTVEIQSPAADFIVRDVFTMKGLCSDEQGLKSITVTLRNTQTSEYYPTSDAPFTAIINKEQTEWECVINPFDEANKIPDGSYEATATATDKAGRKIIATKSFKIDNTPPLLILTRPSTSTSVDGRIILNSTDTYGQELIIQGEVADDNNVDLMEVKIYDQNDELKATVPLTNIPPTIDISVATWLDENYNQIYGESKDGTKYYYCEIVVYDEARKLPADGNDKGNAKSYYYLEKNIPTNYRPTHVYKILNGTYKDDNIKQIFGSNNNFTEEQIAEKVNEVKAVMSAAENQTTKGTFSLNPENNPYYELFGYKSVSNRNVEDSYNELKSNNILTNGSPLNINIYPQ